MSCRRTPLSVSLSTSLPAAAAEPVRYCSLRPFALILQARLADADRLSALQSGDKSELQKDVETLTEELLAAQANNHHLHEVHGTVFGMCCSCYMSDLSSDGAMVGCGAA